jgi:hypothetical protein
MSFEKRRVSALCGCFASDFVVLGGCILAFCGFSSNFESAVVVFGCSSVGLGWVLVSGVESGGFSMCVVVSVFRVWVLTGFSSDFAVLVGGLLLYWASRGVEAAAITTMEGWDLPSSG